MKNNTVHKKTTTAPNTLTKGKKPVKKVSKEAIMYTTEKAKKVIPAYFTVVR
ncbi:hypothetical protein N1F78_13820 [Seonamhaeicola sp. MEBiC1930]|uniref:hypothetical protein n=1 Tax=Seonamhaeicola sp. MEBiC01930 TaxID=2976768 RepID=UPI003255F70A